jgi:hypothetical protein
MFHITRLDWEPKQRKSVIILHGKLETRKDAQRGNSRVDIWVEQ